MWLFKNRHGRWQQRLSAYLDAQLEPLERRKLEQHLASCTSCQEELESLRATVALLQSVPQVAVPRSFRLIEEPMPVGAPWTVRYMVPLRYAAAAAGLLFLVVAVGDLMTSDGGLTGPVPPSQEQDAVSPSPAAAPVTEAASQEIEAPSALSAVPEEEVLPEAARVAPSKAATEPEGDERTLLSRTLGWLAAALGLLFVALAVPVSLQWWLKRRAPLEP
ncbi:MAG: zf-HC2 domain-containing protein [Chloroflexi bacterium]|nr:zf-HC2 domain-containing protein [Chloroflexota bacterium]